MNGYAVKKNLNYYLCQLDMGIRNSNFYEQIKVEYNNFWRITLELLSLRNVRNKRIEELANKKSKTKKYIQQHKNDMSEKLKRLLQLSTEKGASNWLTKLRPLLSMVLGYQSNIFGILSVKGMAEKFQTYQQCVHLEVDLKYTII